MDKLVYTDKGFHNKVKDCNVPVDGPLVLNGCYFSVKDDTTGTDLSAIDCGKGNILGFMYAGSVTINNCHFPKDYNVYLPPSNGNTFMTNDTLGSFNCVLEKRSLITANNYVYGNIYVDHSDVSDYVITLAGTHFMDDSANQVSWIPITP